MKAIKFNICYKNCSVRGVGRHNETEDEMKRVTIQIAIAGISALVMAAVLLKPQYSVAKETGKQQVTTSAQYACTGTFPGSQLFYAEK
jgi:hypothetical protein